MKIRLLLKYEYMTEVIHKIIEVKKTAPVVKLIDNLGCEIILEAKRDEINKLMPEIIHYLGYYQLINMEEV